MKIIDKVFGTRSERELKRIMHQVDEVESLRPKMQALSDEELKGKTAEFKKRLEEGATLDDLNLAIGDHDLDLLVLHDVDQLGLGHAVDLRLRDHPVVQALQAREIQSLIHLAAPSHVNVRQAIHACSQSI